MILTAARDDGRRATKRDARDGDDGGDGAATTARPTARRDARRRRRTRDATTRTRARRDDEKYSNETKLRSEAQAPFRVARQFVYGACAASATIGFGIATIQAATRAAGAANAPPLEGSLENLAIDGAALALFGFLYAREEDGARATDGEDRTRGAVGAPARGARGGEERCGWRICGRFRESSW